MNEIIARLQALYNDAVALRPPYSPNAAYRDVARGYVCYAEALSKLSSAKLALRNAKDLLGLKED